MATPYTLGATWYDHYGGDPETGGHTTDGGRVFGITRARYVECERYGCRPLVVIDPEDREQVGALDTAYQKALDGAPKYDGLADVMRDALRILLADVKPDEPQGLGAVVEDSHGELWIRDKTTTTIAHWKRARGEDSGNRYRWDRIAAVQVLSEGVTA